MIQKQISELKSVFLKNAFHVEKMIGTSIRAIKDNSIQQAQKVINEMEQTANNYEVQIEQECISVSARFQPEAKNLRTVIMIMKMNVDLERIADMCVNVSDSFLNINKMESGEDILKDHTLNMFEKAAQMYKLSVSSFINEDIDLAKSVVIMDEEVDCLNKQIVKDIVRFIEKTPALTNTYLHYVRIAKNIERIADLATNICEDVIYMVKGVDIRHQSKDSCGHLNK